MSGGVQAECDREFMPVMTPITRLPPEILVSIFKHLKDVVYVRMQPCKTRPSNTWAMAWLVQVSRQWRTIVEPIIYNQIAIRFDVDANIDKLLKTLQQNPRLCHLIRQLTLFRIGNLNQARLQALLEIVRSSSMHVKTLELLGGTYADTGEHLRMEIAKMKFERLRVTGFAKKFIFQDLLSYSDPTKLKDLTVVTWIDDPDLWLPHITFDIPPSRRYTWSIKSLELDEWKALANDIHILMSYPLALVEFKLSNLNPHDPYYESLNASTIQKFLDLQRHSLQKITLGAFSDKKCYERACRQMPDFTGFPQLEELQISDANIYNDDPQTACQKLCAPNLKRLIIDMECYLVRYSISGSFDGRNATWFVEFATYRRDYLPASRLQEIHINYWWYESAYNTREYHLASTKSILADLGIRLTYTSAVRDVQHWVLPSGQRPMPDCLESTGSARFNMSEVFLDF